jgi:hypothetical protein
VHFDLTDLRLFAAVVAEGSIIIQLALHAQASLSRRQAHA